MASPACGNKGKDKEGRKEEAIFPPPPSFPIGNPGQWWQIASARAKNRDKKIRSWRQSTPKKGPRGSLITDPSSAFLKEERKKTIWEFVRARVFNRSDTLPNCTKLTTLAGSPSISHRQGQGIIFQDLLAQTKEGACTCRSRRLGRLRQEKKRGERERETKALLFLTVLNDPLVGKVFFSAPDSGCPGTQAEPPPLTSVTDDVRVGGRVIFAKVH